MYVHEEFEDETMTKHATILRSTPYAAILEQMAEECAELGQALLKKARKLRGESFTPKTMDEIQEDLIEEFTDVVLCADILQLTINQGIYDQKLNRWIERHEKR